MRLTIIAIAATFAAGTAASAQERKPFTGPHIDAVVGYDRAQGGGDHDSGVAFGGGAGWDFDLGRTIRVGVEAEALGSTQKQCVTGGIVPGDSLCTRAGRDLYAGARIGTLLGERTMLYAKAGHTNARVTTRYRNGSIRISASDDLDGMRVGVGLEHMLTDRLSAKAEYRYSNYEQGVDRHQLVAGIAYRF